jgi:hypothetical protein
MYDQAKHGPVDAIKGDYIAGILLESQAITWIPVICN